MRSLRNLILLFTAAALFSGCGLFGIRFNLTNPKKAGKYPKFTEADELRGTLNKFRVCYDVKHYALNITVDPETKSLKGYVDIVAEAVSDFDTLQIDLYKNMNIGSIEYKGKQLSYLRRHHAVYTFPRNVKKGETITLRVNYDGKPIEAPKPPWDGGFVWKKDKNDKPWIGVACEGDGASMWWPCKDHLSDEPDSTAINITVPSGLMCVANGRLRDSINTGAQTTYKWFVSSPINNYNVTIYVGDLKLLKDSYKSKLTGKTLDIHHYVLPYNYEKAKTHFKQLHNQLDFYEKYFGEYAWYDDTYKMVESPYAGMEHQSAIAYGNGYANNNLGFDYIVLHETAHEWWGNSVTNFDLAHVWIHEGFATYCEALYVEQAHGYNAYLQYLLFQRLTIKNKRPVVGPEGYHYFNYKDGDVYVKGSWILHTLRNTINNDTLFLGILKSFAVQNKAKIVVSDDFIKLVNERTGQDYGWFFKQYLYNRKVPVLEYNLGKNGELLYRWAETGEDFKMPLKIINGGIAYNLSPTSKTQTVTLAAGGEDIIFPKEKMLFIAKEVKKKRLLK